MSKKPDNEVARETSLPSTVPTTVNKPSDFKAVKKLTMDVTSIARLGEIIMQCTSELYTIDMDDPAKPGEKRPVACVDILDCLRGEEFVFICGAVARSTLARYNGNLKGQYFAMRDAGIKTGKRYRMVEIVALERVE